MVRTGILSVVFLVMSWSVLAQDTCLEGDCENGYGKMRCDCGYLYEGEFKNGEKVKGTLTKEDLVYTGEFKDDIAHGKGRIAFADSSWYKGDFRFSQPDGIGEYHLSNGYAYYGQMREGNFEGWGFRAPEERTDENYVTKLGQFADDKLTGWGVIDQPSSLYVGQVDEGKPNGWGMQVDAAGVWCGSFRKGKRKNQVVQDQQTPGMYSITISIESGAVLFMYQEGEQRVSLEVSNAQEKSVIYSYSNGIWEGSWETGSVYMNEKTGEVRVSER